MNVKNLFTSGDFVCPLPLGLPLVLQYNSNGHLEKVFKRYGNDRTEVTKQLLDTLIQANKVPQVIHIKNGTSWVYGVMYTNEMFDGEGKLPVAIEEQAFDKFQKNPQQFNFFAWKFDSTAVSIKGAAPIKQALQMAKFNTFNGLLMTPYNGLSIESFMNSDLWNFGIHLATDVVVYKQGEQELKSVGLSQFIADKVEMNVDRNGYFKACLTKTDKSRVFYDYSTAVKYNILPKSVVVIDNENQVVYSTKLKNPANEKRSSTIGCPACGKLLNVPTEGSVQCPNETCSSRLITRVGLFLNTLKLSPIPDDKIKAYIDDKKVISLPDILLLPEFSGVETTVTLGDLLRSLVPMSIIGKSDVFSLFSIACSNKISTFEHYTQHTQFIETDLGLTHPDLIKLKQWLASPVNQSDLQTLLHTPQIKITEVNKKFDGAPIFRNKTIYITGEFIRGTSSEIISILQSYSAKVTSMFSDTVNCVLVGGKNENTDGQILNAAKNMGIPIMGEVEFFERYDIDSDIRAVLNR